MNIAPPNGLELAGRLQRITGSVTSKITRNRRWTRIGLGIGVGLALAIGSATAATAFYPHYVTFGAYTKPLYVQEFADCMSDRDWDTNILSLEASNQQYPAGDGQLVELRVLDSRMPDVGRDVDLCRARIEKVVGESLIPDSMRG